MRGDGREYKGDGLENMKRGTERGRIVQKMQMEYFFLHIMTQRGV